MSDGAAGEQEWERNTTVPLDKNGETHQEGVIEYSNNSESWEGWQFAPGEVVAAIPGAGAFDPELPRSTKVKQENVCRIQRRIIDAESGFRCYLVKYLNTDQKRMELASPLHKEFRRLGSLQRRSIDHTLEENIVEVPDSDVDLDDRSWDFDSEGEQ